MHVGWLPSGRARDARSRDLPPAGRDRPRPHRRLGGQSGRLVPQGSGHRPGPTPGARRPPVHRPPVGSASSCSSTWTAARPSGIRFGMTGSLAVDGTPGVDQMRYAPKRRTRSGTGGRCGSRTAAPSSCTILGGWAGVLLDPDVSGLGPDAMAISPAQLAATLRDRGRPLKARLLDQSRVAGIGNLIADELLWRSALSPAPALGLALPATRSDGSTATWKDPDRSHRGGRIPHRPPDGGAPHRRALPPRRDRADPVHGRGPDLVVVRRPPALTRGVTRRARPRVPGPRQPSSSASTLAAWPSAFTWYQGRSMVPSAAMRKVERITPTDFLP